MSRFNNDIKKFPDFLKVGDRLIHKKTNQRIIVTELDIHYFHYYYINNNPFSTSYASLKINYRIMEEDKYV